MRRRVARPRADSPTAAVPLPGARWRPRGICEAIPRSPSDALAVRASAWLRTSSRVPLINDCTCIRASSTAARTPSVASAATCLASPPAADATWLACSAARAARPSVASSLLPAVTGGVNPCWLISVPPTRSGNSWWVVDRHLPARQRPQSLCFRWLVRRRVGKERASRLTKRSVRMTTMPRKGIMTAMTALLARARYGGVLRRRQRQPAGRHGGRHRHTRVVRNLRVGRSCARAWGTGDITSTRERRAVILEPVAAGRAHRRRGASLHDRFRLLRPESREPSSRGALEAARRLARSSRSVSVCSWRRLRQGWRSSTCSMAFGRGTWTSCSGSWNRERRGSTS